MIRPPGTVRPFPVPRGISGGSARRGGPLRPTAAAEIRASVWPLPGSCEIRTSVPRRRSEAGARRSVFQAPGARGTAPGHSGRRPGRRVRFSHFWARKGEKCVLQGGLPGPRHAYPPVAPSRPFRKSASPCRQKPSSSRYRGVSVAPRQLQGSSGNCCSYPVAIFEIRNQRRRDGGPYTKRMRRFWQSGSTHRCACICRRRRDIAECRLLQGSYPRAIVHVHFPRRPRAVGTSGGRFMKFQSRLYVADTPGGPEKAVSHFPLFAFRNEKSEIRIQGCGGDEGHTTRMRRAWRAGNTHRRARACRRRRDIAECPPLQGSSRSCQLPGSCPVARRKSATARGTRPRRRRGRAR